MSHKIPPRSHLVVLGIAALIFTALTLFGFRENPWLQLLAMLAILLSIPAFIAAVVFIVTKGGYKKTTFYLPLCAVILALYLGRESGAFLRGAYFTAHLPELKAFALAAPDAGRDDGLKWKDVPVSAETTEIGHRFVIFWWGSGFPVRHTVLAYYDGTREQAEVDFRKKWFILH